MDEVYCIQERNRGVQRLGIEESRISLGHSLMFLILDAKAAEFLQANSDVLATFQDKNKFKMQKNLFVRESLEIRRQNTGPGKGLNDDYSSYVKTYAWGPLFKKLRN
jgi:replication-associated recombination protein RarA